MNLNQTEQRVALELTVQEFHVIFCAMAAMVIDDHSAQNLMTTDQWDSAETMWEQIRQTMDRMRGYLPDESKAVQFLENLNQVIEHLNHHRQNLRLLAQKAVAWKDVTTLYTVVETTLTAYAELVEHMRIERIQTFDTMFTTGKQLMQLGIFLLEQGVALDSCMAWRRLLKRYGVPDDPDFWYQMAEADRQRLASALETDDMHHDG